jgi:hypothetical protein
MKHRTLLIALTFASLFLGLACEAASVTGIPMPFDDRAAKLSVWTNSITAKQIEADRQQYDTIEEQLRKLPESRLKALFGAPQDDVPKEHAVPVHHRELVCLPGYYPGKMRSYFLPISNFGGILVYTSGDGDFIASVTLYLKTDSGFTALRSSADYPARHTWDLQHTEVVRKHIQKVISK